MSMINFIKTPFPDNHDGFDYAPKSFMDVQHEMEQKISDTERQKSQSKLLGLLTSIFK